MIGRIDFATKPKNSDGLFWKFSHICTLNILFNFFEFFNINLIIFRHGWLVFALPTWKKYWFLDFQRVHWPSLRSSWTNCWNSMKNNDLQQRGRINLTNFFVICAPYNASYFLHLIENIFMYVLRMHDFTSYGSNLQIS